MLLMFGVSFFLMMVAVSIHEFAHGWMAYKFGDRTAKYSGRLTINPFAHIDPIWTILVPLFLFISTGGRFIFGAAKPVPVNYWALKNPRRDIIWVGLAGPSANFLFAFLLSWVYKFLPPHSILNLIMQNLIAINIVLGIFNLIPIPPLDGSRILIGILPHKFAFYYSLIEPFGFIILFILIWQGFFHKIILPLTGFVLNLIGVKG